MSTSTTYVRQPPAPQRQESGEESDIAPQTKANTLANAAATSSSPHPNILSTANAPKDEVAPHNTPTSGDSHTQQ